MHVNTHILMQITKIPRFAVCYTHEQLTKKCKKKKKRIDKALCNFFVAVLFSVTLTQFTLLQKSFKAILFILFLRHAEILVRNLFSSLHNDGRTRKTSRFGQACQGWPQCSGVWGWLQSRHH